MEEGRKKLLKKVPTRKLLASIKSDIRKVLKPSESAGKSKNPRP
jgi:hypothetical protein